MSTPVSVQYGAIAGSGAGLGRPASGNDEGDLDRVFHSASEASTIANSLNGALPINMERLRGNDT